jgi:predicted outer membrane repeat protein
MTFLSLLRTRRATGRRRARDQFFQPRLESLEDRATPSTFLVLDLSDSGAGSLRQAISDANALPGSDVIEFSPELHGTIALTSDQLEITDDLTINGPGAQHLIISGQSTSRVLTVSGIETEVAITNVTIADGSAAGSGRALGGGILNDGSGLTLSHVAFSNNVADSGADPSSSAGGGAIANVGASARLSIDHALFVGNQATGHLAGGGAIASLSGASLTVSHSHFDDNQATAQFRSAGGAILTEGAGAQLAVNYSSFTANSAIAILGAAAGSLQGESDGGALANQAGSTANISHASFIRNQAVGGSAGPSGTGGGSSTSLTANSSKINPSAALAQPALRAKLAAAAATARVAQLSTAVADRPRSVTTCSCKIRQWAGPEAKAAPAPVAAREASRRPAP